MSSLMRLFLLTLIAAPVTYLIYRLARGLGYLEPAASKQHEYRRTITAAVYALLLFLPVFFYGWEKGWPRIWIVFGVANALALLFFGAVGVTAAVKLWRLRHSDALPDPAPAPESDEEPSPLDQAEITPGVPENPS